MKAFGNNSWLLGISVAIGASLCCITPVLAFLGGFSGITSTFSWIEPFRPFLMGGTVLVFGFAWYQKLKPKKGVELECNCDIDEKKKFLQSKGFLAIVTVFAAIMMAFPYYSFIFYPVTNSQAAEFSLQENLNQVVFEVEGMTCTGCETHVSTAVSELEGINEVKASYETGNAIIKFDPELVSENQIVQAINEIGYKVVDPENLGDH